MQYRIAILTEISSLKAVTLEGGRENFSAEKIFVGVLCPYNSNGPCNAGRPPPSSRTVFFDGPRKARYSFDNIETMLRSL